MSIPSTQASLLARLGTDADTARRLLELLGEALATEEAAVAAFEEAGAWTVEVYFEGPPDQDAVRALIGDLAGDAASENLTFSAVVAGDWIAHSLAGLAPVAVRRFVVHGAHDRHRIAPNRIAIEIEAALAFGTGHHGTTQGCLTALNRILDRKRPRRILDIGCGTGVLAIAAARATRRPVVAGDIDPVSVRVARDNARHNRVGALVKIVQANGLAHRRLRVGAPFDLVFANILLGPLKQLARPVRRVIAAGGRVVISGLLAGQAEAALAVYRAHGLALERRILLDGWMTLVLTLPATRIVGAGRVGTAKPAQCLSPPSPAKWGRVGRGQHGALPTRRRRARIVRPRQMTLRYDHE